MCYAQSIMVNQQQLQIYVIQKIKWIYKKYDWVNINNSLEVSCPGWVLPMERGNMKRSPKRHTVKVLEQSFNTPAQREI